MCGNEGADKTYCLDLCNGYEGVLDGVDNFKYRYYLVSYRRTEFLVRQRIILFARPCEANIALTPSVGWFTSQQLNILQVQEMRFLPQ